MDHAERGGGSAIGNLLLAWGTCNGDEKREMSWEAFLRMKCGTDAAIFQERSERIVAWRAANPPTARARTAEIEAALREAEAAIDVFGAAYDRLRTAVRSAGIATTG